MPTSQVIDYRARIQKKITKKEYEFILDDCRSSYERGKLEGTRQEQERNSKRPDTEMRRAQMNCIEALAKMGVALSQTSEALSRALTSVNGQL
jgi:hypothetical protein